MSGFRNHLLILLLFLPGLSGSQNNDSIEMLNKLCWETVYSNPDSALVFGRRAKKLAIEGGSPEQVGKSNILLGIVYDVKASYDSAMLYYHQALKSAQYRNDTALIAGSLSNIGLTFLHIGAYYKALENLFNSMRLFESMPGNVPALANVYNNIGLIYSELGDHDKALGYFERSFSMSAKNNDLLNQGAVYTNMAIVHFKKGQFEDAIRILDSSIQIKNETTDYYGLAISYNQMAEFLIDTKKYNEASQMVGKALSYSKKINDLSNQAISYQTLQQIYVHQGQFDKAVRYNNMALELAEKINDRKLIMNHYRNLSEVYKAKGSYREAYTNFLKFTEMKDTLISDKQLSNIYQLEFQHQLNQQQSEINLLQERQEIQTLKIERQELLLSKRNLQMILIASVLSILLLLLYMQYMKARHRHKRELVVTTMRQKSRQVQKIIQAEINERKRISQEIHDSLGQLLSLIKMNISNTRVKMGSGDVNVLKKVDETLDLVDHSIVELRNIIKNISPVMLREKGLANALDDMIRRLQKVGEIDINLEMLDLEKLEDDFIGNMIFSVIQELLNNAIKHASCTIIDIQVVHSDTDVNIMVEDNGRGFDEQKVEHGLGIRQIREKVSNLGGYIEFDSMEGRGTIVTVEIPTKKIFEV